MRKFSLKQMLSDPMNELRHENVTPLRDEIPSRPQTTMGWPPAHHGPKPSYPTGPKIPDHVSHEMTVAKEIFVELLNVPPDARDRIMHMTADLLRLYAPPVEGEAHEVPEGSPV